MDTLLHMLYVLGSGLGVGLIARATYDWWVRSRRGSWLSQKTRRKLAVHLSDGTTVTGLLAEETPDGIVLSPAEWETETQLLGDVYLPRAQVLFLQVLPN